MKLLPFLLFLNLTTFCFAQYTITGRVIDEDTEEGLPFANVFIKGTTIGTATDVDGYFEIKLTERYDSLAVSAIGYHTKVLFFKNIHQQNLIFKMTASDVSLSEVVVIAGENPANAIVKGIIAKKDKNSIENLDTYQCESYTKIEIDLEGITAENSKRAKKELQFIFDYIDSTSDETPYLPAYLNEVVQEEYWIKAKSQKKEIRIAERTSGVTNESVITQIKRIHDDYNIYDNWIPIMERNLASPFSNLGLLTYEYYIIDSAYIDGQWAHQLKFKPRRKQENTFYGDFWVLDTSFAIARVNMRMSEDVNINLVDRVIIYEEFQRKDSLWLPSKQKMIVDFQAIEKGVGLIGRKTKTYRNYHINDPTTATIADQKDPEDVILNGLKKDKTYWDTARHEPLTTQELNIYQMIDTIQELPLYKTISRVMYALAVGYIKVGKIEIGPYASLYSVNHIEGHRFRMGIATSNDFSKNIRLEGYAAYGTNDQQFKYGGKFQWNVVTQPRRFIVGGAFTDDVISFHTSSEDPIYTNFFSGYLRRNIPMRLLHTREGKLYVLKDWKRGFTNRLTFINRQLDPYGNADGGGFEFKYLKNPTDANSIDTTLTTTELTLRTRFAFKEHFLQGDFDRVSYGSKYPIVELTYTKGWRGILGSEYNYHKVSLEVSHWFYTNPAGWLRYKVNVGKTFGTLPFLLLEVHPGNETYFYEGNSFNAMNRYEFASDTYVSWVVVHHFDGFILNHIPLLRKLKWRSLASFRGVWGTMTPNNAAANQLNTSDVGGTIALRSPAAFPYLEASVGIENIFKFFNVHAIWRLNYLDNPEAFPFMVQAGAYFYF